MQMTRIGAAIPALTAFLACTDPSDVEMAKGPWLFLSHAVPPTSVMDALYHGPVALDSSGCFRLQDRDFPERHTVIWPFRARLVDRGGALVLLDEQGADLGRIGDSFRLGGGEVPQEIGLGFLAPELVEPARTRCPGRYWVVGEVVR
jgi:hypothetical protein